MLTFNTVTVNGWSLHVCTGVCLSHSDLDCSSDEAEEVDGDRDRELAMDSGFTPVADQPGLYYKVLNSEPLTGS